MKIIVFNDPHSEFNKKTLSIHKSILSKIDQNSFDLVAVVGDWGSSKISDVEISFKTFRDAFPNKKIIGVLGNHDLWDKENKSLLYKFKKIEEFSKKYDIHLLEKNPLEIGKFLFLGFNGWYNLPHFDTKDSQYMYQYVEGGKPVDSYLNDLADQAINFIIDYPKKNKKVIALTHFPCVSEIIDMPSRSGNPNHGKILLEFSDLILFGHTHIPLDKKIDKTRIINVGSGYNELMYRIIDLNSLSPSNNIIKGFIRFLMTKLRYIKKIQNFF